MYQCKYYKVHNAELKSNEIRRGANPPIPVTIPLCEHPKHSPAPRARILRSVGGTSLNCRRELDKCPIKSKWHDLD